MNQIQFSRVIGCIGLIVLLLGACSWSVRKPSIPVQKNGDNTTVTQTPVVVESEESTKPTTQEKPPQKVVIKNLVDGNYKLCTEPPTSKTSSGEDWYGWCFIFRKTGNHVVGIYTYWAPSDYARICISGRANGNTVSGSGYEILEGGSEPITPESTAIHLSRGGVWDDWFEDGNNLRVGPNRLYSTGKYPRSYYYAWTIYDSAQLDLNGFYQRDLEKLILPEKCPF